MRHPGPSSLQHCRACGAVKRCTAEGRPSTLGGTLPASVLVLPVMEPTITTRLSAPSFFGSACGGRV